MRTDAILRPRTPILLALTCALALMVGALTAPPAQAYSVAIPTGLRATSATSSSLTVSWSASSGASGYRIQYATASSMASPQYLATTQTSAVVPDLLPGTMYWLRVAAAANGGTGVKQSDYTQTPFPSAATRYGFATPTDLRATSATSTTLTLGWTTVANATDYRVMYSASANLTGARYASTTTNAVTLTGLAASTTYYLRVAVVEAGNGAKLSDYTQAPYPTARTAAGSTTPYDLRLATFNLSSVSLDSDSYPERKWAYRRAAVASSINTKKPDVVGLQEASQATSFIAGGVSQYDDLRNALNSIGGHYELTNTYNYNCESYQNPNNCVFHDWGASQGTRIMYNNDTMSLVSQGSVKYSQQVSGSSTRYLAWAVLKIKSTGHQVFVVSVHIDAAGDVANQQAQWQQVINETTARHGSLPVVVVGDFNSHRWSQPAGTMLPKMAAAGFGDVLNQKYQAEPTGIRAENVTNGFFHSWNGYQRDIDGSGRCFCTQTYRIGAIIDDVFVTNSIRVKSWEMVLSYNSYFDRVGVIPSDHNMVMVTLVIP